MENLLLPSRLAETAAIYLIPLGLHGAESAGSGLPALFGRRIGAWDIAIRDGAEIRRATLTPAALQDWAVHQPANLQARIAELIQRLTGSRRGGRNAPPGAPILMGIVNATPDSFSDGGDHGDPGAAIEHGRRLAEAGARILDIGGESTRPGATPVAPEEEIRRILPVLQGLQDLRRQTPKVALSIDTRHGSVMRAALAAGVDIINDVSALTGDPGSLSIAAASTADIVLMHMRGEPRTMNLAPVYADVSLDVFDYLEGRIEACVAAGMERHRLIVDPGIGFGKRGPENLAILRHLALFHGLGCPILLGASRKGFGDSTQVLAPVDRLPASLAAAMTALAQGAQILRVHDVAETRQALDIWRQIDVGAG